MRYADLTNEKFKNYVQRVAEGGCTLQVFFKEMVSYVGVALGGEGHSLPEIEKKIIIPRVKLLFAQISSCVGDRESVKDVGVAKDLDDRFSDVFKLFVEECGLDIELVKFIASKAGIELESAKKALAVASPLSLLLVRTELFLTKAEFKKAIDCAEQIISNPLAEKNMRREAFKGKINGWVGLKNHREATNCAQEAIAAGFAEKVFYHQKALLLKNNVIAAFHAKKIVKDSDDYRNLVCLYEEACTSCIAVLECGEPLDKEDYADMTMMVREIESNDLVELKALVCRAIEVVAAHFTPDGVPRAVQLKVGKLADALSRYGVMGGRSSGVGAGVSGDDVAAASSTDCVRPAPKFG